jgi:hypothetical protein
MKTEKSAASKSKGKVSARPAHVAEQAGLSSGRDCYPREKMIAEAAYYYAKQRGFAPENEIADWLQAEADVDTSLRSAQSQ